MIQISIILCHPISVDGMLQFEAHLVKSEESVSVSQHLFELSQYAKEGRIWPVPFFYFCDPSVSKNGNQASRAIVQNKQEIKVSIQSKNDSITFRWSVVRKDCIFGTQQEFTFDETSM